MNEPPRLFESDPAARDAIDAARSDMPDAKRLAKIGAAAAAAATVTGAAATASAGTALAVKIVAGVVLVGAIGVGTYTYVSHTPAVPPSASVTAPPPSITVAPPSQSAPPLTSATPSATENTMQQAPRPSAPPPLDEMSTLDEAQQILATDPGRALALCDKDAVANPKGSMAQEREVLAIDALMRLKRTADAETRAKRFHAAWPDSAHGRRVDALVNLH